MMNPVSVQCRSSQKPFYAVLHRIDVGLVIDFEPIKGADAAGSGPAAAAGAMQSHKLAAKAISRLQSLPGGDIGLLCDAVVEEVSLVPGACCFCFRVVGPTLAVRLVGLSYT